MNHIGSKCSFKPRGGGKIGVSATYVAKRVLRGCAGVYGGPVFNAWCNFVSRKGAKIFKRAVKGLRKYKFKY